MSHPSFLSHRAFFPVVLCLAFAGSLPRIAVGQDSINLAVVAKASSSYVSGDTRLTALNDGFNPRSSRDAARGSYGNWNRTTTQWVEYEWAQPISTKQMDVYWWADGVGIGLPKACRVLYWDGNALVPVKNATGLGVEA